jgi:hypothetical protein
MKYKIFRPKIKAYEFLRDKACTGTILHWIHRKTSVEITRKNLFSLTDLIIDDIEDYDEK